MCLRLIDRKNVHFHFNIRKSKKCVSNKSNSLCSSSVVRWRFNKLKAAAQLKLLLSKKHLNMKAIFQNVIDYKGAVSGTSERIVETRSFPAMVGGEHENSIWKGKGLKKSHCHRND